MAALHFFVGHWTSMSHLWRDSRSHRFFPSRFLERVEMEPARFYRSLRIVDLRRLRFRRFGNSLAAITHRAIHSIGKELSSFVRRYLAGIELDLPALAPARFVLTAALRFKASSSNFDKTRHCPRDKSPKRRFPIRRRTSRFTS